LLFAVDHVCGGVEWCPLRLLKLAKEVYIGGLVLVESAILLVAVYMGATVDFFHLGVERCGKECGVCTMFSTSFAGRVGYIFDEDAHK
jgi:hypothetical protein